MLHLRSVRLALACAILLLVPALARTGEEIGVSLVPALTRLGADRWHTAGHRGKGVTVAVLDSGFRGWQNHLGAALPPRERVQTKSFRPDGNLEAKDSQHGILCGEIVHALAPDANLLLANWEPERPDTFLQAVRWAKSRGAKVFTCSVIMPSWSDCEGGGAVHAELRKILGDDAVFVASAGNTAQRHWRGDYQPGPGGWHAWEGTAIDNLLSPWSGEERVSVELCCPAGASYEVCVCEYAGGRVLARDSVEAHPGAVAASAVVKFQPRAGDVYQVRVKRTKGSGPFHVVALGAYLGTTVSGGSIPFPADGADVVAVGAVDDAGQRAAYSSCGPNSRLPKPDLVAAVPFPSRWRAKAFGGTSAAAPQAAAAAALCWSANAGWPAAKVRQALERAARDLGPKGHDCETGYGQLTLPAPPAPEVKATDGLANQHQRP